MPEVKVPEYAVIVVLTFEELENALALPPSMHISHVQKRGLTQELFLRLEDVNCPEVPSGKGARIAMGRLVLGECGAFEALEFDEES